MADTTISALTAGGSIVGNEAIPMDQSGNTRRTTPALLGVQARSLSIPSDDTCEGIRISLQAAVALSRDQAVYVNSAGKMALADADALATGPCIALATATTALDAQGWFLLFGVVRDDSVNAFTPGQTIYLSTTAGGYTTTAPSGVDDVVQVLGVALTADTWLFSPQLVRVEHV